MRGYVSPFTYTSSWRGAWLSTETASSPSLYLPHPPRVVDRGQPEVLVR